MDQPMLKKIWKLNVPPKVRTFLWQACSNILPTRGNLHRRELQVEPTCGLCCQCIETVEHVLWECSLARNVWALSIGKIQKCTNVAHEMYRQAYSTGTRAVGDGVVGNLERKK